jgi:hypothetical protein
MSEKPRLFISPNLRPKTKETETVEGISGIKIGDNFYNTDYGKEITWAVINIFPNGKVVLKRSDVNVTVTKSILALEERPDLWVKVPN